MTKLSRVFSSCALVALGFSSSSDAREPDSRGFFAPEVIVNLPADIRAIVVDQPSIFWAEDTKGARPGGIFRVDVETRKVVPLWEVADPRSLTLSGDHLYFLHDISRSLSRVATTPGSGATEILRAATVAPLFGVSSGGFNALAIDTTLYLGFVPLGACNAEQRGGVLALEPSAKAPRVLAQGCPETLTVSDGHVYWTEPDLASTAPEPRPKRLMRAGVGGGGPERIAVGVFEGAPVVVDHAVYYVDHAPKTRGVYRWDPVTKKSRRIVAKVGVLEADLDNLYLVAPDLGAILTFERDGKDVKEVAKVPGLRLGSVDFSEWTSVACSLADCEITSNAFGRLDKLLESMPDLELEP